MFKLWSFQCGYFGPRPALFSVARSEKRIGEPKLTLTKKEVMKRKLFMSKLFCWQRHI